MGGQKNEIICCGKKRITKIMYLSGMSGTLPGAAVFDRSDTTDWKCLITNAYSGTLMWFSMRLAVWTSDWTHCTAAPLSIIQHAANHDDRTWQDV